MASAILTLSACNKILSTKPTDYYTSANYYQNADELQQALDAIYGNLQNTGYSVVLTFNFCASNDELLTGVSAATDNRGLNWSFDASSKYVAQIYQYCYVGIENANALIDNINTPVSLDSSTKHIILGQALFLRGYYYFLLTMHFGKVPLILHVPNVTDVNIAATSQDSIYQQIETDMKEAESLLQEENYTSDKLGYNDVVTLTAVQAILARVYMYWAGYPQYKTDKYADALTYCNKVINSGIHSLNPNYRQIFINLSEDIYDTKEDIWEVGSYSAAAGTTVRNTTGKNDNDIGNFVGIKSNYLDTDTTSWAAVGWVRPSAKLFGAYEVDPNSTATVKSSYDIRRDWNCANYYWDGSPRVKYTLTSPWAMYSGKFRREYCPWKSRNAGIYGINWPVIRYADVLLMKAEAEDYINGPDAEAYTAINAVRQRGYGLMYGNVVKTLTVTNAGSGYTSAPIVTISGGGGAGAAAQAQISSGKISGLYLSSPGLGTSGSAYTAAPTITIGAEWASGTTYSAGNQVAYDGKLYTVTTAGTSTATPPSQTSGASSASVTGAVFTYAGSQATATASLTTGNEYELPSTLSKADFLDSVKSERLRELNAEGLRRFDLIRWGNYVSYMQDFTSWAINNGISKSTPGTSATSGNSYGLIGLQNISAKDVLLPIPTYELNVNKALQQNPGW